MATTVRPEQGQYSPDNPFAPKPAADTSPTYSADNPFAPQPATAPVARLRAPIQLPGAVVTQPEAAFEDPASTRIRSAYESKKFPGLFGEFGRATEGAAVGGTISSVGHIVDAMEESAVRAHAARTPAEEERLAVRFGTFPAPPKPHIGRAAIAVGEGIRKENAPPVPTMGDAKTAADWWSYAQSKGGEALGSTIPSILGFMAGGVPAAAVASYIQNTGDIRGELEDLGVNGVKKEAVAFALGVPIAALDAFSLDVVATMLRDKFGKAVAAEVAKPSILRAAASGAATGAASEAPTEAVQETIQHVGTRVAAGQPVKSGLGKRVAEAAVGGAAGGILLGGAGGAATGAAVRTLEAEATPAHSPDNPFAVPGAKVEMGDRDQAIQTEQEITDERTGIRLVDRPAPKREVDEDAQVAPPAAVAAPTGPAPRAYPTGQAEYTPEEARTREVAKRLKEGRPGAIDYAAQEMVKRVPKGAVLVPLPNHEGATDANKQLAQAIASYGDGLTVVDVLTRSGTVEDTHARREAGQPGLTADEQQASMSRKRSLPKKVAGRPVYFVDNLETSGATMYAARVALGDANAESLVFAKEPVPTGEIEVTREQAAAKIAEITERARNRYAKWGDIGSLLVEMATEQERLQQEVEASGKTWRAAADTPISDFGSGGLPSGQTFSAGRNKRQAGLTSARLTQMEERLKQMGVSDDDINAARFDPELVYEIAARLGGEPAEADASFEEGEHQDVLDDFFMGEGAKRRRDSAPSAAAATTPDSTPEVERAEPATRPGPDGSADLAAGGRADVAGPEGAAETGGRAEPAPVDDAQRGAGVEEVTPPKGDRKSRVTKRFASIDEANEFAEHVVEKERDDARRAPLARELHESGIYDRYLDMEPEALIALFRNRNKLAQMSPPARDKATAKLDPEDWASQYGNHALIRQGPAWFYAAVHAGGDLASMLHAKKTQSQDRDAERGQRYYEDRKQAYEKARAEVIRLMDAARGAPTPEPAAQEYSSDNPFAGGAASAPREADDPFGNEVEQAPLVEHEPKKSRLRSPKKAEMSPSGDQITLTDEQLNPGLEVAPNEGEPDLIVIPCGSDKKPGWSMRADELYTGQYFRAALKYARAIAPDSKIRILSAKHGLLRVGDMVRSYDVKFGDEKAIGIEELKGNFREAGILQQDTNKDVRVIGGKEYIGRVAAAVPFARRVLPAGLGIGEQLSALKKLTEARTSKPTEKPAATPSAEGKRPTPIEQARALGRAAFDRGVKAVPALDPELMKLVPERPDAEGRVALYAAWSKAWHAANLAAPVEGMPRRIAGGATASMDVDGRVTVTYEPGASVGDVKTKELLQGAGFPTDRVTVIRKQKKGPDAVSDLGSGHTSYRTATPEKAADKKGRYVPDGVDLEAAAKLPDVTEYDTPLIKAARLYAETKEPTANIKTLERDQQRDKFAVSEIQRIKAEAVKKFGTLGKKNLALVLGLPGAGKTSGAVQPLAKFLKAAVSEVDDIRPLHSEYEDGWGSEVVLRESGQIAREIRTTLMEQGVSLVVPGTGADPTSVLWLLDTARANGYTVHLVHVGIAVDVAQERAVRRFESGGHFVRPEYIVSIEAKNAESYEAAKNHEAVVNGGSDVRLDNNVERGEKPRILEHRNAAWLGLLDEGVDGSGERESQSDAAEPSEVAAPSAQRPTIKRTLDEEAAGASAADIAKLVDAFERLLKYEDTPTGASVPSDAKAVRQWAAQVLGRPYESRTWTMDDAYDAIEGAVNNVLFDRLGSVIGKEMRLADTRRFEERFFGRRARSEAAAARGQFSTPLDIARAAAIAAGVRSGEKVLEPTAGTGNLVNFLRGSDVAIDVNEIEPRRIAVLRTMGLEPTTEDALRLPLSGKRYNAVVMNPPFGSAGAGKYSGFGATPFKSNDISQRFVASALSQLVDGGRLVAIMPDNVLSGASADFRQWLKDNHTPVAYIASPVGSYETRGTPTTQTVMVVVDKGKRGIAPAPLVVPAEKLTWEEWRSEIMRFDYDSSLRRGETGRGEATDVKAVARLHTPQAPEVKKQAELFDRGTEDATVQEGEATHDTDSKPQRRAARLVAPRSRGESGGSGAAGRAGGPSESRGGAAAGTGRPADVVAEPPSGQPGEADAGSAKGVVPQVSVGRVEPGAGDIARREREVEAANASPVFAPYALGVSERRNSHPRLVVETRSMAGMPAPPITAKITSPLVERAWGRSGAEGGLSDEQMDAVLRTLTAWDNGHGMIAADDVGVGKTREAAALVLEAIARGEKRILYTTKNEVNVFDAMAEFRLVATGRPDGEFPAKFVFVGDYKNVRKGTESLPMPDGPTVYFAHSYNFATFQKALGEVRPTVWIPDEAHEFKNVWSTRGIAWRALHDQMLTTLKEKAYFAYFTATPAVTLDELGYLYGLREWPIGGFGDWVEWKLGKKPKPKAEDEEATKKAAEESAREAREMGDRGEGSVSDLKADDKKIKDGKKKYMSGTDVFQNRVTPAETEQVMRELKGSGHYIARDLWRGGVKFEVQEVDLLGDTPVAKRARAIYNQAAELARDISVASRKFGRMNKEKKTTGLERSLIQSYLKQLLFQLRLPDVLAGADKALARGEQVVISVHSVTGDAELEEGLSETDSETPVNERLRVAITRINTEEVEKVDSGGGVVEFNNLGEIPEAVIAISELLDRLKALTPLVDPVRAIEEHFGPKNVAVITGKRNAKQRKISMGEFQRGARKVALISKAGKIGISLHDVNGRKRWMGIADYEWSADTFKQELGRVDRTGQQTHPHLTLFASNLAGERKFAATIAARMSSLGATSKGSAESTGTDALDQFDVSDGISLTAMREAVTKLDDDLREYFTGSKFREWVQLGKGTEEMRTKRTPDQAGMKDFLLDMLMFPVEASQRVWEKWVGEREAIKSEESNAAAAARRTGRESGTVTRRTKLTHEADPPLTMVEVKLASGEKRAILQGFVTQYINEIQGARGTDEMGRQRSRHYVHVTTPDGEMLSGLELMPGESWAVKRLFGKGVRKTMTPSEAWADLQAGDNIAVKGANGERWVLHRRKDGRTQIQGTTLAKHRTVLQGFASFETVGNYLYIKDDQEAVEKFLKRFPPKLEVDKAGDAPDDAAEGEMQLYAVGDPITATFLLARRVWKGFQTERAKKAGVSDDAIVRTPGQWFYDTLYSRLEKAIEGAPIQKGTVEQWRAAISKNVAKGEREWTEIDAWLDQQKGTLAKAQVLEAARAGRVEVSETMLGGTTEMPLQLLQAVAAANLARENLRAAAIEDIRASGRTGNDASVALEDTLRHVTTGAGALPQYYRDLEWSARTVNLARAAHSTRKEWVAADEKYGRKRTGYHKYQEPGGANYREILIQLQRPLASGARDAGERLNAANNAIGEYLRQNPGAVPSRDAGLSRLTLDRDYIAQEMADARERFPAQHPEFGAVDNILVHVRVNDRTVNGEQVLFIEEIQSDWHQQGRKRGYNLPEIPSADLVVTQVNKHPYYAGSAQLLWRVADPSDSTNAFEVVAENETVARRIALRDINGKRRKGVPDAPFKNTDEWIGLAIKRILAEAVYGGYDRVAWTTGAQQGERYRLDKHVTRIMYQRPNGDFTAMKGRDIVHTGRYAESALPDVIGKEAAAKLLAATPVATPRGEFVSLEGKDLKVNAKGMVEFYDRMIPKVAKEYAKKLGVAVDLESIPVSREGGWVVHDPTSEFGLDDEDGFIAGPFATEEEAKATLKKMQSGEDLHDWPTAEDFAVGYLPQVSNQSFAVAPFIETVTERGQYVYGVGDPLTAAFLLARRVLRGMPEGKPLVTSSIPEVEERWQAAKGVQPESMREKARTALDAFKKLGRHFPEIDPSRSGLEATTHELLLDHERAPRWAQAVAYDRIAGVTDGLTPSEVDLFTRLLVLPDILKDVEEGLYPKEEGLPFGYPSAKAIEADLAKYQREVLKPARLKVRQASMKRADFIAQLTQELVDAELLPADVLEDPRYYHRQVMAYFNAADKGPYVGASKGKEVRGRLRGFQRGRVGGGDFNTRYVEAEYEWVAQALTELKTKSALEQLKQLADRTSDLKKLASAVNIEALGVKLAKAEGLDPEMEGPFMARQALSPFRQKVAIGVQRVLTAIEKAYAGEEELAVHGFDDLIHEIGEVYGMWSAEQKEEDSDGRPFNANHPRWWSFLAALVQAGGPGSNGAATIFKAIREREAFLEAELGRDYIDRKNADDLLRLAPESYVKWQPEVGNHFFKVQSVDARALESVLAGERNLTPADQRAVMAMGAPKETWIIPDWLGATLTHFGTTAQDVQGPFGTLDRFLQRMTATWKQYILHAPQRVLKYNLNNLSGDADAALAYAPGIFRLVPDAARDLHHYIFGRTAPAGMTRAQLDQQMEKLIEQGIIDAGLTAVEIPDINDLPTFRRLAEDDPKTFMQFVLSLGPKYFAKTRQLTQYRENILRLAAKRYFDGQIRQGRRDMYAASSPARVNAVKTDREKYAALLARDLIGDYGAVSTFTAITRKRIFPFLSFQEVNFKRYVRLFANVAREGDASVAGRATGVLALKGGRTALSLAKRAFMVNMFFIAAAAWNALFFADEDDELRRRGRNQLHLILGRNDDGTINSMRIEGAFSDFLEWVGLQDYIEDAHDVMVGDATVGAKAVEAAKAPVNKLVQLWEPFTKAIYESITKRSTFPDVFRPLPIRDRTEHAFRILALDRMYARVTGKPTPKGNPVARLFVYRTDPGEAAYFDTRTQVAEWQDKHGKLKAGGETTEKSNALYYWKRAVQWDDAKATERWKAKYFELGGSMRGMQQSAKLGAPLGALSIRDRRAFLKDVKQADREIIEMAEEWYARVYGTRGGRLRNPQIQLRETTPEEVEQRPRLRAPGGSMM